MACSEVVALKGGLVAKTEVVVRLLEIERRGARFELLPAGRFRVEPFALLSAEDVTFLREHRDEARRLLEYEADAVLEPL